MHKPFEYEEQDTTITIRQYFTEIYHPSILHSFYSYITGSTETLSDTTAKSQYNTEKVFEPTSEDSSGKNLNPDIPIYSFSPDERKVINELSDRITAGFQRQTGIIRVSVTMPESDLAAKIARLTLQTLHEEASSYKTAKARLYKDFLDTEQSKSKEELEQARQKLIEFNGDDSQPLNERMELQSSYEVNLDQYNTLTQQLNRMELNIQEQLPAFRLLDDITVPSEQVQPRRKLMVFLSLLLGFFVAISWMTATFILKKGRSS